jgi:hypothetical protein
MIYVSSHEVGTRICKVFKMDPGSVSRIEMTFDAGDKPKIVIHRCLTLSESEELAKAVEGCDEFVTVEQPNMTGYMSYRKEPAR